MTMICYTIGLKVYGNNANKMAFQHNDLLQRKVIWTKKPYGKIRLGIKGAFEVAQI